MGILPEKDGGTKEEIRRWQRAYEWESSLKNFWDETHPKTLWEYKRMIEERLEQETRIATGTNPWIRNSSRKDYRNGYRYRRILTLSGKAIIKIPRLRKNKNGNVSFSILGHRKRIAPPVEDLVQDVIIYGVSSRKVKKALRKILGENAISHTTVSKIFQKMDQEVTLFHLRPLEDKYLFLLLDGIYLIVKSPLKCRRRAVLVALGITPDLKKEIIDFRLANQGESEMAWSEFLTNLYHRGLEGKSTRLLSADGNKGLHNACATVFAGIPRQLCWAHKMRNVINKVPKKLQNLCKKGACEIYLAESKTLALRAYRRWAKIWKAIAPKAAGCMEKDLEELLKFFDLDPKYWKKVRTTNAIERELKEVRRRTRVMEIIPNNKSLDRILYAIFRDRNESRKQQKSVKKRKKKVGSQNEITH